MEIYINDKYLNKNQYSEIFEVVSKIMNEYCEKCRDKNVVLYCTECKLYPLCTAGVVILRNIQHLENEEKK